ncbi:MAG: DUF4397 domain-containing protein [Nitriliruptoraceae bacterium]
MKNKLFVGIAAAALMIVPATAAMADSHDQAEVVIVHGVPDLEVDIWADGEPLLEGVNFEDIAVQSLPAGSYDLAIVPAGEDLDAAVLEATADVEAGMSYSVVAHLDEGGEPTVLLEANETGEGAGIQVFHTAAFGAVDILPTDATGLEGVTNGQTAFIATGEADVEGVGVAAAGSDEAAIDLGTVSVPADTSVLAYAIGDEDTLTVVTETISVAGEEMADEEEMEQPSEVDSGSGGLLDTGLPTWVAGLMALGLLGVSAPVLATARRRS